MKMIMRTVRDVLVVGIVEVGERGKGVMAIQDRVVAGSHQRARRAE
jgi:hypothetical protein